MREQIEPDNRRAGARFAKVVWLKHPERLERRNELRINPGHGVLNNISVFGRAGRKAVDGAGARTRAHFGDEERLERASCGFALPDGSGEAYNEEAFHYFLEIERKRTEISNRPFLLMLIEFTRHAGVNPEIDAVTAGKLFSVLSLCLRETDFIGWYREGRVAGAVLTQHGIGEREQLSEAVRRRVGAALEKLFPSGDGRRPELRIYQVSPQSSNRE
jgi:hypothetical protein